MNTDKAPLFDSNASATLTEVSATFQQRGTEYGDTWRNAQWLNIKAAGRLAGIELNTATARLLAAAALSDVKYQRMEGPYKRDTVIDRIAYDANFASEVEAYKEEQAKAKAAAALPKVAAQMIVRADRPVYPQAEV